MIGAIMQLLSGGVIDKVGGLVKTVFGDKEKRDDQRAEADSASMNAFTAESGALRSNRNWFDSLIDGLNRLPRPLGFFGIIGLFGWAVVDPMQFTVAMTALGVVPDWLQQALVMVLAFYYAGRWIAKDMKFGTPNVKKVKEVLALQKTLREGLEPQPQPSQPSSSEQQPAYSPPTVSKYHQADKETVATDKELQSELAGPSDKPMSLPSIMAWNKKYNASF